MFASQTFIDLKLYGYRLRPACPQDIREAFLEMREYDVPYHIRFAIDTDVRCGHWYTVRCAEGATSLERRADLLQRAEPRICAFDIETTKLPLQFPNAEYDQVGPPTRPLHWCPLAV